MAVLLLFSSGTALAQTQSFQSAEQIHQKLLNYLKQKVAKQEAHQQLYEPEFELRALSETLKLPACQTELQIHDRNPDAYAGRMTLGVSCDSPKWQVYIPANVNGKINVVMTRRAVLKNTALTAEDLQEVLIPYRQEPAQSVHSITTAIGMRTKRALGAQTILKIRDLQPPYWVFKQQKVTIITHFGAVEVRTSGTALENGVKEQQVEIINNQSQKTLKGIVIAPNTVYIP
ncbi:MAG: flagellar basal body P-ring formation protein FlgA [Thiotrichales bacterium]|nr:flagellar basal body P-ring formation protein FlgA [Thiotrichales bacterium]